MITNTIHLSDCVEGMSALPKGSVDVDSDYITFANRRINAND